MSIKNCLFNLFPVEIIEIIFDYLSVIDIFNGLLNISEYLNEIILNYNLYKINFLSILKNDFDLICNYINIKQIKSLLLSDGIDTPFQSNLFLKLFKIDEFNLNLNNFYLIDINDQSMELINNNLYKLNNLFRLTIINCNLKNCFQLKNILLNLKELNISSEYLFDNLILMSKLKYLIISNYSSFNQLEILLNYCPNLISLNISIERKIIENIFQINSNLTYLTINMSNFQINLIELKKLLNCFNKLISFEIECRSDLDLCDGYQWELFFIEKLKNIKKFNFKFQLKSSIILNSILIKNILNSYSSLFWLNEKHWFIAIEIEQRLIYSVPKFSSESADIDFHPPIHRTLLNDYIYYDNINALAIWNQSNNYFKNVKELWLIDHISNINLNSIINLNLIQSLIFISSENNLSIDILINLILKMNNLYFIKLNSFPFILNENNQNIIFKQIRSIEFVKEIKSFSSIQFINKIFPKIQRLNIKIRSLEEILNILNIFSNSLSIVKFHCNTSNIHFNQKSIQKILNHSNFTYSIDNQLIRLWIGSNQLKEQIQFEEKQHRGCFSWCNGKKFLFKR